MHSIKMKMDSDGSGQEFDATAPLVFPQFGDDETEIISKADGTTDGNPVVMIKFETYLERHNARVPVATVISARQFVQTARVLMATHPSLEGLLSVGTAEDGIRVRHGKYKGVGWSAVAADCWIVTVEGTDKISIALDDAALVGTAEKFVNQVLDERKCDDDENQN